MALRDPTELRRLYRVWRARADDYNAMIEDIISGAPVPIDERSFVVDRLKSAYDAFMAEAQHFIHSKEF